MIGLDNDREQSAQSAHSSRESPHQGDGSTVHRAKDHRSTVQDRVSIEELDLMQDAQRELEHLSKLATADRTKRFGKLYRLVRQIPLLTIAGKQVRQNTGEIRLESMVKRGGYRPRYAVWWLAQNQYHPQAVRRAYQR